MPTVDQVCRAAHADMNATSVVMREWRRAQTAQAAPATVLPEALQQVFTAALASLWNQALALANESLRQRRPPNTRTGRPPNRPPKRLPSCR